MEWLLNSLMNNKKLVEQTSCDVHTPFSGTQPSTGTDNTGDLPSWDEFNPAVHGPLCLLPNPEQTPGSCKYLCKTPLVLSDPDTSCFCLCGVAVLPTPAGTRRGIQCSPNTSHILAKLPCTSPCSPEGKDRAGMAAGSAPNSAWLSVSLAAQAHRARTPSSFLGTGTLKSTSTL